MFDLPRKFIVALPIILAVVGSESGISADTATFGKAPTYSGDTGFVLALSDDKKAFTATFSNLIVTLDQKSSVPIPIITRTFSFSLPLASIDPGTEIPFFISGAAFCEKGANVRLIFTINEQSTVAVFSENTTNSEYVQELKYKAGAATEARVTIILMADRDSTSGAQAYLNVLSIDADLLNKQDKQGLLKKVKEFVKKPLKGG
jgi:hypothetical protein